MTDEKIHAFGFALNEANGKLSRDSIVLASGENLGAGTVLGKTATAGTITAAAAAGNIGNGTIGTLSVGGGAKPGVYRAILIEPATNAGVFEVIDPDGVLVGRGSVAVAFAGPINFTIADGATDFVSGDLFDMSVSQLTTKHKKLAPAATDGTERACAVLGPEVDASAGDTACAAITRFAELSGIELTWPAGITAAQKDIATAQLQALGIVIR